MNSKEFFERAIPAMLEKYPAPEKDGIIGYVNEEAKKADNTANGKKRSFFAGRRRLVIIPVIAAVLLAMGGAVVHRVYRIGFEESDVVTELKVGRYYVETEDGYSRDCYIEVFEDNKIQIVGIEKKDCFENGNYYDWNSAPVAYRLDPFIPFIFMDDAWGTVSMNDVGGVGVGICYKGADTLILSVKIYECPDAKDYTSENDKEIFAEHGDREVHCVYEPFGLNEE